MPTPPDTGKHIVKSYDEELNRLRDQLVRMGAMAEAQLFAAVEALSNRDVEQAQRVIEGDTAIDDAEHAINEMTVRLLALRQPVAYDLRIVLTTLKVAAALERVADYAANVAKRALVLGRMPPIGPTRSINRLGMQVLKLLKDSIDAYIGHDAEQAVTVWQSDREVDDLYAALFRELLTYMMEDPRTITACTHLMFIAKNIERIGDHATNIAEETHYLVTGGQLRGERPKSDDSSFATGGGDQDGPA